MKYQRFIFAVIILLCFILQFNYAFAEDIVAYYDIFSMNRELKNININDNSIESKINTELSNIVFDLNEVNCNQYSIIEFYFLPEVLSDQVIISINDISDNNLEIHYTRIETMVINNGLSDVAIKSYNNQIHCVKIIVERKKNYKSIELIIDEEIIYNNDTYYDLNELSITTQEADKFTIYKEEYLNNEDNIEENNGNSDNTEEGGTVDDNENLEPENDTDNNLDEQSDENSDNGNSDNTQEGNTVDDNENLEPENDTDNNLDDEDETLDTNSSSDEQNFNNSNSEISTPDNTEQENNVTIPNTYIEENSIESDAEENISYGNIFVGIMMGAGIIALFIIIHKGKSID